MKPDLLVTWIKHCDYPIFRYTLRKYRDQFNKIIIYWSEHNRFPYYDHFIHDSMMGESYKMIFMDPTFTDWANAEDWRHHATTEMLKQSTSDWVCSIEQDWFCRDWDQLFSSVNDSLKSSDMFGWWNPTNAPYIHPAFWFMKRELLEKTSKDFKPHGEINGSDHFAMMTYEAEKLGAKIDKFGGEVIPDTLCFHLGGVNQNYLDFEERFKQNGLHRPDLFYIYNWWSMQMPGQQSPAFYDRCKFIDSELIRLVTNKIPETSEWSKYFKVWP